MKKYKGIVKGVYIPSSEINPMNPQKLGFKIDVDGQMETLEVEHNEVNAEIMKNDYVLIIKQLIDNVEFIDIEPLDGDIDE